MQSLSPVQGRTASASKSFFKLCAIVLQPVSKRHAATYRRSRIKLNIKPDPTMLPSKTEAHDHIIYNPPPSMPNIYHTPTIFLPKDDRRRELQAALNPNTQAIGGPPLLEQTTPPPVRQPYEKRYHLNTEQMKEMRALREDDPYKWTRSALAKRFDCSNLFVAMVTEGLTNAKQKEQKQVTELVRSNWGVKRRTAREDRTLRKERWYRDA